MDPALRRGSPSSAKTVATIFQILLLLFPAILFAFAGGSVSGIIKDRTGGSIPGASLTLVNSSLRTRFHATTDTRGFYSFPSLPVGHYDLTIEADGFQTQQKIQPGAWTPTPRSPYRR